MTKTFINIFLFFEKYFKFKMEYYGGRSNMNNNM